MELHAFISWKGDFAVSNLESLKLLRLQHGVALKGAPFAKSSQLGYTRTHYEYYARPVRGPEPIRAHA